MRAEIRLVLSPACLVGKKPTWTLSINLDNSWDKRLAKIFVKIFCLNLKAQLACTCQGELLSRFWYDNDKRVHKRRVGDLAL